MFPLLASRHKKAPQMGGSLLFCIRSALQSSNAISKLYRVDMYDFQVETSRLQVTDNSKILIKDTGDIFHTDEYGTVYKVTVCA